MFNKLRQKIKSAAEKESVKIVAHKIENEINMGTETQATAGTPAAFWEGIFGKNWRTTLAGWVEGSIPIIWALLDAYNSGTFNGKHGLALALAIAMIVKGYVSKDSKVTGLAN